MKYLQCFHYTLFLYKRLLRNHWCTDMYCRNQTAREYPNHHIACLGNKCNRNFIGFTAFEWSNWLCYNIFQEILQWLLPFGGTPEPIWQHGTIMFLQVFISSIQTLSSRQSLSSVHGPNNAAHGPFGHGGIGGILVCVGGSDAPKVCNGKIGLIEYIWEL